jgi:4-hydroxybenzoate polyprenyltransferase
MKHTWLGPLIMGSCRALNLLLAMSHAPALAGPIAWCTAAAYGLYVAGITVMSRSETSQANRGGLFAGLTIQNSALLGLAGATLAHQRFPKPDLDQPLIPLESLLVLALVALAVNARAARAIQQPTPELVQKTVKTGILSLVWLLFGVVAGVRGPGAALLVAMLWVPAFLLGRWLYST